jgi:hypothetical protein
VGDTRGRIGDGAVQIEKKMGVFHGDSSYLRADFFGKFIKFT